MRLTKGGVLNRVELPRYMVCSCSWTLTPFLTKLCGLIQALNPVSFRARALGRDLEGLEEHISSPSATMNLINYRKKSSAR